MIYRDSKGRFTRLLNNNDSQEEKKSIFSSLINEIKLMWLRLLGKY